MRSRPRGETRQDDQALPSRRDAQRRTKVRAARSCLEADRGTATVINAGMTMRRTPSAEVTGEHPYLHPYYSPIGGGLDGLRASTADANAEVRADADTRRA